MPISAWPEDQRPREKLIKFGADSLSNAELLAVFLRVGVKGKSAVELGQDLINHFGSLNKLFSAPLEDFAAVHGLGPAKYAQFQAVLEMAKRSLSEELEQGVKLNSAVSVSNYLRLLIGSKTFETFAIMFLDVKHRLLQCEELFRGSLTQAKVYPREIIKRALYHNAASVILAHNHPSGETTPSDADLNLTKELVKILGNIEVRVLDHIVVAETGSYSFAEHGLL